PNDFLAECNPMLAFAARCTSSFPAAFEPMKLEHVDRLKPGFSMEVDQGGWGFAKFFRKFERFGNMPVARRPLADGGYLNNKPLRYVIDSIRNRGGDLPVQRKLLYVDPFPEMQASLHRDQADFDFMENTLAAASTLPRCQAIREELERVNRRNRKLES